MPDLTIENVSKTFAGKNERLVFSQLSLTITLGTITALVGPNGSGKTTLLNCIAQLTDFEAGCISIDKQPLDSKNIGFVFQNYRESLFPWLTNIDNIACCFNKPSLPTAKKHTYIQWWANELGVQVPWNNHPYESSGGEQQMVVLLRELVNGPQLLLLDEPFAALDYEKRLAWHEQLLQLWEKTRTTVIIVSHDIEEAVYLADEVVVLGKNPTKISGRYHVPLPRPRTPHMLVGESFFKCRSLVLKNFSGNDEHV